MTPTPAYNGEIAIISFIF